MTRPLEQALGLGPALLACAAATLSPWIAASVVEGPAVALGALQRAGRVVDMEAARAASVRVLRRATTGTAVYIGGRAVVFSLALPHVGALAPDASPRTLLNRNVRGFLKGLGRAGAAAHYFGREWIAIRHRPAALLAFDTTAEGAVLIEVIAGVDASIALPPALASADERALDRWRGKVPASLREVLGEALVPEVLAREVVEVVAQHAAVPLTPAAVPEGARAVPAVTDAADPLPPGFVPGPIVRVPIGWLDTAFDPASGRIWLGGDVLAPLFAVRAIAAAAGGEAAARMEEGAIPLEGATARDLTAAVQAALQAPGAARA